MIFRVLVILILFVNALKSQNFSQKIFPGDPKQGAYFGRFVAQNDDYMVISAYKDFGKASSSGSLYFFQNKNGQYTQTQKIFPEDGTVEQFFGYSIGINNDWIITGAHHDSSKGASSGAAYILKNVNTNEWRISQKLVPDDLSEADEFGKKVDLYGQFAVSSSYLDDDFGINSGSVYIFKLDSSGYWHKFSKIYASTPAKYSQFGLSVDLFKDKLIAGAPFEGDKEFGSAYIFEFINNKWIETAKLMPEGLNEFDQFGITVKINEDFAFVSSIKDDDLGENSGAVYVFKKRQTGWKYSQKLKAPDGAKGDGFGIDIELSDSIAIIGSYFDDDKGQNSGSIYFFQLKNNKWSFQKKITADDGEESDAFGSSISLKGDNLLVGAYSDSDEGFLAGSAYVFSLKKTLNTKIITGRTRVFPSIVYNLLTIESNYSKYQIKIYDIKGRIYKNIFSNKNNIIFSVEELPKGLYFISLESKKHHETFKIVKF